MRRGANLYVHPRRLIHLDGLAALECDLTEQLKVVLLLRADDKQTLNHRGTTAHARRRVGSNLRGVARCGSFMEAPPAAAPPVVSADDVARAAFALVRTRDTQRTYLLARIFSLVHTTSLCVHIAASPSIHMCVQEYSD